MTCTQADRRAQCDALLPQQCRLLPGGTRCHRARLQAAVLPLARLTNVLLATRRVFFGEFLQAGQPVEPSARFGGLATSGSAIGPYSCPATSTYAAKALIEPLQANADPDTPSRALPLADQHTRSDHVFTHVRSMP